MTPNKDSDPEGYAAYRARRNASQAKYRAANRDKAVAATKKWQMENPDKARDSAKRWADANKEQIDAARRVYRDANRERYRLNHRAWAARNRENLNRRAREWQKANLDKAGERNRRYRARKKNAPEVRFTAEDWRRILKQYDHRCYYCDVSSVPLEREHRMPLARVGSHTPENVVPACRTCNAEKGTLTDSEYIAKRRAA